jgi:hypothetical protein
MQTGNGDAAGVTTISELSLSQHETLRTDLTVRSGKHVIAIARWKKTPSGLRRTGQSLEFGQHRLAGVLKMLAETAAIIGGEAKNATP